MRGPYNSGYCVSACAEFILSQLMLKLSWVGLEHEAGIGLDAELVNVAGAGVVNT